MASAWGVSSIQERNRFGASALLLLGKSVAAGISSLLEKSHAHYLPGCKLVAAPARAWSLHRSETGTAKGHALGDVFGGFAP
jgi:hypothetical protein